jgi:hypothetical protein
VGRSSSALGVSDGGDVGFNLLSFILIFDLDFFSAVDEPSRSFDASVLSREDDFDSGFDDRFVGDVANVDL